MTNHGNRIIEIGSGKFKDLLQALNAEFDCLIIASEEENTEGVKRSRERLDAIYEAMGSSAISKSMLRKIRNKLGFPDYPNHGSGSEEYINALLMEGYQSGKN